MESICKNGLRKEGEIIDEESLSTVDGHIKKGVKFRGIDNWSSAVFVSPSVYYSGHQVYAKETISEDITWMPVVHVKVAKGSYTAHEHTLWSYEFKDDEPRQVEWRVENSSNVKVISFIFVKKGHFDKSNNYKTTTSLMKARN